MLHHPFMAITPRPTLTQSDITRQGPIYESNRTVQLFSKNYINLKLYSCVQIIYIA